MQHSSRYIIYAGLWAGCAGVVYFLCLAAGLPLFISLLLIAASCFALWRFLLRYVPGSDEPLAVKEQGILYAAAVTGTAACVFLARKYGDWDAVYIYNLAARFLQDPHHWRRLFDYHDQFSHADYPLHIPSLVALGQRISGGGYREWVPAGIALFYTVSIPLLLFGETVKLHRMLALVVLVAVLGNTYYLNNGMIQCADVPLSFYLLLAFISMQHYRRDPASSCWLVVYGISLGLCAWTKNEGLLYALIMIAFHFPEWRRHAGCLLSGFLPLLAVLVFFKSVYAPANDLVSGFKPGEIMARLGGKDRYKLIAKSYSHYLAEYFYASRMAAAVYLIYCIYRQHMPHRDLFIFAAFGLAMTGVYLFSYHDLAWHLENSLSRILLQWYPSFWFVLTVQFAALLPPKAATHMAVDK